MVSGCIWLSADVVQASTYLESSKKENGFSQFYKTVGAKLLWGQEYNPQGQRNKHFKSKVHSCHMLKTAGMGFE